MNTHDKYALPPLPEPLCNLPTYCQNAIKQYTRSVVDDYLNGQEAAIEADCKRRGEPVAGYTMVPVEPTPQMIAAFRSGFQNELHKNDRRRTMSAEEAGLRAMLKATPHPAEPAATDSAGYTLGPISDGGMDPRNEQSEPVKVPSDAEILSAADRSEIGYIHRGQATYWFNDERIVEFARALLARYGQPCPHCDPVDGKYGPRVQAAWHAGWDAAQEARDAAKALIPTEPSKDEIRDVLLKHGYTIKPGHDDLKPYVYEAARALLTQFGESSSS